MADPALTDIERQRQAFRDSLALLALRPRPDLARMTDEELIAAAIVQMHKLRELRPC